MNACKELSVGQLDKGINLMSECLFYTNNIMAHQGDMLSIEELFALETHNELFSHILHSCQSPEEKVACYNEAVQVVNKQEDQDAVCDFAMKYLGEKAPMSIIRQSVRSIASELAFSIEYITNSMNN